MYSRPITNDELVQLYKMGATRKLEEHELFIMRAMEQPEHAELFEQLAEYVDIEWRYYDMAQHYYAGDFAYFENGLNDDLLQLTKQSELSPKLYSEYLRQIDPSQREYEKITHGYLAALKRNMDRVKVAMR